MYIKDTVHVFPSGDLESGKEGVGYGGLTVQSDVLDQIQWTSDLLH